MGAEGAIVNVRRGERGVRDAFHEAGALDPTNAKPLADIGIEESMALHRLERHAVVRESSPGCYYLDEDAFQELRSGRRKMALMFATAVVLTGLVVVYAVAAYR